jgi:hypothetical protein
LKRRDPKDAIDIALADTVAGRHWLHPAERLRGNLRLAAIRAMHRARYVERQRQEREERGKPR